MGLKPHAVKVGAVSTVWGLKTPAITITSL
jgi:hypothetical protein